MKPLRRAPRTPSITRRMDQTVIDAITFHAEVAKLDRSRLPLIELDESVASHGGVLRVLADQLVAFSPAGEACAMGSL